MRSRGDHEADPFALTCRWAAPAEPSDRRMLVDCVRRYCYCRERKYCPFDDVADFGYVIQVKENAPDLLRRALSRVPVDAVITGDYQPAENRFEIPRRMPEVCLDLRFPVLVLERSSCPARSSPTIGGRSTRPSSRRRWTNATAWSWKARLGSGCGRIARRHEPSRTWSRMLASSTGRWGGRGWKASRTSGRDWRGWLRICSISG
jgi:hypothetical protein